MAATRNPPPQAQQAAFAVLPMFARALPRVAHRLPCPYQLQSKKSPSTSCHPAASVQRGTCTVPVEFLSKKSGTVDQRILYSRAPSTGDHETCTEPSSKMVCVLFEEGPVATRIIRRSFGVDICKLALGRACVKSKHTASICKFAALSANSPRVSMIAEAVHSHTLEF